MVGAILVDSWHVSLEKHMDTSTCYNFGRPGPATKCDEQRTVQTVHGGRLGVRVRGRRGTGGGATRRGWARDRPPSPTPGAIPLVMHLNAFDEEDTDGDGVWPAVRGGMDVEESGTDSRSWMVSSSGSVGEPPPMAPSYALPSGGIASPPGCDEEIDPAASDTEDFEREVGGALLMPPQLPGIIWSPPILYEDRHGFSYHSVAYSIADLAAAGAQPPQAGPTLAAGHASNAGRTR